MRNQFFVVTALGASMTGQSALAQTATFRMLQNTTHPFLSVSSPRAMSADGRVVEGAGVRWTAETGVVPTGFLPGFNVFGTAFALNFDGSVAVGSFIDSPSGHEGRYWKGPQGTTASLAPSKISGERRFGPYRMTDNGNWFVTPEQGTLNPARFTRSGIVEYFPKLGFAEARILATSADGSVALGYLYQNVGLPHCVVWFPGNGPAAASSSLQRLDFWGLTLSSTGELVAGVMHSGTPAIWQVGGDVELFNPALGSNEVTAMSVSANAELIAGMADGGAFVRRPGEQARDLRVVLKRFGADEIDYYLLKDNVLSVSRDGRTVVGFATSPWYSSGAYIATIPFWEPCPADLNFDGVVDDVDFTVFAAAYDVLITTDGDLNIDAQTDDSDFVDFVVAYETLLCP